MHLKKEIEKKIPENYRKIPNKTLADIIESITGAYYTQFKSLAKC